MRWGAISLRGAPPTHPHGPARPPGCACLPGADQTRGGGAVAGFTLTAVQAKALPMGAGMSANASHNEHDNTIRMLEKVMQPKSSYKIVTNSIPKILAT